MTSVEGVDSRIKAALFNRGLNIIGQNEFVDFSDIRGRLANRIRALPNSEIIVGLPSALDPLHIRLDLLPPQIIEEPSVLGRLIRQPKLLPEAVVMGLEFMGSGIHGLRWSHVLLVDSNNAIGYKVTPLTSGMTLPKDEIQKVSQSRGALSGFIPAIIVPAFRDMLEVLP